MVTRPLPNSGLDAVKDLIERSFPTPIAAVFRKCRLTPEEDLGGRHKNLIDLFEITAKFLAVVALQDARVRIPDFKSHLPQREQTLHFLRRPSLGGWVGLLRILVNLKPDVPHDCWLARIREWYLSPKAPAHSQVLQSFKGFQELGFDHRSAHPLAELCNLFVTYRNKQLGHGAHAHEDVLRLRLPILEDAISHLLQSLVFLEDMRVFHTERVEKADGGLWQVHSTALTGSSVEPQTSLHDHELELQEVYLDPLRAEPPIRLGPFLIWRLNEELKQRELYVFNDAWRTKLEYLSYVSGSYHFHRELHEDFGELLELKLKRGSDEDAHLHLAPEERSVRAEELFKRAVAFRANGKDEDALECLEQSAEYERRADTFLEMAELQESLGDPPEAVLQTLQQSLDLDPEFPEAERMWDRLMRVEAGAEGLPVAEEIGVKAEAPMTLLHLATPAAFRPWALLFWIVISGAWFAASAAVEVAIGDWVKVAVNGLQFLLVVLIISCVGVGRRIYARIRIPLSLQLDSMRLSRFDTWFGSQVKAVFGSIQQDQDRLRLDTSLPAERAYLVVSLGLAVLAGFLGFILCELYQDPPPLMVKRWLDNMLVAAFIAGIIWRYIFFSTVFVYRFSRLSLRPMLTKLDGEGFRALAEFMIVNYAFLASAYIAFLGLMVLEFTHPLPFDFVFLAIAVSFFTIWSVGLPWALRSAARESKGKAVQKYAEHLERAFKAFLDDPDEARDERYRWLLARQDRIRKVPTWPLTAFETVVFVLGINLLMVAGGVWYVLVRLGISISATAFL